jgi:hypothetical protein
MEVVINLNGVSFTLIEIPTLRSLNCLQFCDSILMRPGFGHSNAHSGHSYPPMGVDIDGRLTWREPGRVKELARTKDLAKIERGNRRMDFIYDNR